jgi:hypothetical protein
VAAAAGSSVTTLQQAYNNSTSPEILTDSTLGAITVRRGSAADTDNVLEIQNGAGSNTATITGAGLISGTTGAFAKGSTGDVFTWKGAVSSKTGYLYSDTTYVGLFDTALTAGTGILMGEATPKLYGFVAGSIVTTTAAGSFGVAGAITANATGAAATLSGATTSNRRIDISNTSGTFNLGVESSAGGAIITGSTAYAAVLNSGTTAPVQIGVNSELIASFSATGAAFAYNANAGFVVGSTNTTNGVSSFALFRATSDVAVVNLVAHASARTLTRYGLTLGGWNEILHTTGNGLVIGTITSVPIVFGINNAEAGRFTTGGGFHVGSSSGTAHAFLGYRNSATEYAAIFRQDNASGVIAAFQQSGSNRVVINDAGAAITGALTVSTTAAVTGIATFSSQIHLDNELAAFRFRTTGGVERATWRLSGTALISEVAGATRVTMPAAGGFDITGALTATGDLTLSGANAQINPGTSDGSDTSNIALCGGGGAAASRGAFVRVYGNEGSSAGNMILSSGNVTNATIAMQVNAPVTINNSLQVAGYIQITDGMTAPGSSTGVARIYVDTADGDLKIVFADGTIKTIVTDT